MGPPQTQIFSSGVLADRESPEQPLMTLNKEHHSQTHVRLIGVPRSPGYYMTDPGGEGDSIWTAGDHKVFVVHAYAVTFG